MSELAYRPSRHAAKAALAAGYPCYTTRRAGRKPDERALLLLNVRDDACGLADELPDLLDLWRLCDNDDFVRDLGCDADDEDDERQDRKSTRLNSSHGSI